MAEKDVGMKNYLKYKLRFADLINGTIYNGKQIIKEDDLSEQPNEYGLILEDKKGKTSGSTLQGYCDESKDRGILYSISDRESGECTLCDAGSDDAL